jgi:transposase InsO family protein
MKLVNEVRKDHPTMGIRTMYHKLNVQGMGRDNFEHLCRGHGLLVISPKNYRKTTDSQGVTRFDNLLLNLEIRRVNQVWQSDITYYELGGRFYYITLIQDAYSKLIVGYKCSKRLTTEETTLPAIKLALTKRKGINLDGLIFHSDGGGQYYDNAFKKLTASNGIKNSMGETCYENAMAESLNGVIKNKYLKHFYIDSFSKLEEQLDRVVALYNHDKPHSSLKRMTPMEFELSCITLSGQTKATMMKSIDAEGRKKEASSLILSCQTKAQIPNIIST